ncbi:hypothetical protein [Limnohabitans sp.]|jgi:hypothetical protein|uniref:hypothetical protein n=1 Tax=Limnohabitans sp. TaxID=1907725 RepID=UPI00286FABB0|nr:hypothetical protein [Limnohabitans sp.]
MHQIGIPISVSPAEVIRKTSLGAALDLCLELGGFEPKQVQHDLKLDKAQFSRWQSGQEGVNWPKLTAVMDFCGNDAPLLWMCHQRGWDLNSIRKVESEIERQNRLLREENLALRRVLQQGAS